MCHSKKKRHFSNVTNVDYKKRFLRTKEIFCTYLLRCQAIRTSVLSCYTFNR